ncbi:MAG TPA: FkbM family methyltransferase [Actinomycetota bacterium]|nr:FkbM family methyltransferase [Actinomycetota bacterium]
MEEKPAPSGPSRPNACAGEHPVLMELLVGALGTGDVFLDIGANTGFFVLPIAELVGSDGRVLAFEPAPDAAHVLRSAARTRGVLSRISLYEIALSDEVGSLALRADPAHPDDTTKRSLFMDDGPVVAKVPIRRLDELVDSGDVELSLGIDAVKIDVEGAEVRVLRGMRRTLERHRPRMIVIETIEGHLNRAGSSVADVDAFMRDLGYGRLDEGTRGLELNAVFAPT